MGNHERNDRDLLSKKKKEFLLVRWKCLNPPQVLHKVIEQIN